MQAAAARSAGSAQAETILQSTVPLQVSRKWGGRERFRGQRPPGSNFPHFTAAKVVFQDICLKRILSLLSPEVRPFCHSQRNTVLGSACQQHLGTARAALLTQVVSQHSSKERTLSCPQSYPTATQLGDARFWVFLFRNLFRGVDFHSASSWFDTRQKLCPEASMVTDLPRTRILCHKS